MEILKIVTSTHTGELARVGVAESATPVSNLTTVLTQDTLTVRVDAGAPPIEVKASSESLRMGFVE